jgi:membrane fusion protein (multidrug efflux system)
MLTVPRLAVVKNAGESSVFVVENSTAHLRRIRTGVELSRNVEVLSGLKAGDQVVYYGLLALKDNDPVNLQALGNADEVQESNRRGK